MGSFPQSKDDGTMDMTEDKRFRQELAVRQLEDMLELPRGFIVRDQEILKHRREQAGKKEIGELREKIITRLLKSQEWYDLRLNEMKRRAGLENYMEKLEYIEVVDRGRYLIERNQETGKVIIHRVEIKGVDY